MNNTMATHLADWSYRRGGAVEIASLAMLRKQGYTLRGVIAGLVSDPTFERFDGTAYIGSDGSGCMWRVAFTVAS